MNRTPTPSQGGTQPMQMPQAAAGAPAQPGTAPAPAGAQGTKSVVPQAAKPSSKKLAFGCLSAFGCSIFLFLGILIAFVVFGSTENPIFSFFGVPPGEVVNTVITIVNLLFLGLVFVSFIVTIIGVFRRTTLKKEDGVGKKKANIFTFIAFLTLIFFIVSWVSAYFFLAPKRTAAVVRSPIVTEPTPTVNLTAPITIGFDASNVSVNTSAYEILSYLWDFGDDTEARGMKQTHTYTDLGNFTVTLKVTVKDKNSDAEQDLQFTHNVTIQNVLADVVIKATPTTGPAPLKVTLDGSKSSSKNGELIDFAWDLNGDGAYDDSGDEITETTFNKVGSYIVSLRVTDSTGAFATAEVEIEATLPDTPQASIEIQELEGATLDANTPYIFTGGGSVSPTGTIDRYEWDFGDGEKATTRSATHTFANPGSYEVLLRVTDSKGKRGETTKRYTVVTPTEAPVPQVKTTPAATDGTISGEAPFLVNFDATASRDRNDDIVEYRWDFDGDGVQDATDPVVDYTFAKPGSYTTKLTIVDAKDLTGSAEFKVEVRKQGLTVEVKTDHVDGPVPLIVSFDASASRYPDGRIVSYLWDFGDGTPPRSDVAQVTHQYTKIGNFLVTVTAFTSDKQEAQTDIQITVRPVSLSACFEPSTLSGSAPLNVSMDPSCSTGTVIKYLWTVDNGETSTDRRPTFTFDKPGKHEVKLEVRDPDNIINTITKIITVN